MTITVSAATTLVASAAANRTKLMWATTTSSGNNYRINNQMIKSGFKLKKKVIQTLLYASMRIYNFFFPVFGYLMRFSWVEKDWEKSLTRLFDNETGDNTNFLKRNVFFRNSVNYELKAALIQLVYVS